MLLCVALFSSSSAVLRSVSRPEILRAELLAPTFILANSAFRLLTERSFSARPALACFRS